MSFKNLSPNRLIKRQFQSVTGTATGITAGDDIRIDGDKLKIAPDGEVTPVTRRFTQNDPKRLIARVPELPSGQYMLRVVTRFSNSAVTLKEPRVIAYDILV